MEDEMTDQTEIDGTKEERPAVAGVRFSLSEAPTKVKSPKTLQRLTDDVGPLLKLEVPVEVALTTDEACELAEVGPAVRELIRRGVEVPSEAKNTFKLSVGRDFAGAKYTITGTPGRVEMNAQLSGTPSIAVVKGKPKLALKLVGVVREADHTTLTKYLSSPAKLTVEPPQQELDFAEAAE